MACRALKVSRSGYYGWVGRCPSARDIVDAHLVELIRQVHAELRPGRGLRVGRKRV